MVNGMKFNFKYWGWNKWFYNYLKEEIKIDIVTLAIAKKFALKVAAGFSSVTVDELTSTINFTLNDGNKVSLKIPQLRGIKDIYFEDIVNPTTLVNETHLIILMTDDTKEDAGVIPNAKIAISKAEGNALSKKQDGLYVAEGAIRISNEEANIIEQKADGIFATINSKDENTVNTVLDIVKNNVETEDLNFSDFLN